MTREAPVPPARERTGRRRGTRTRGSSTCCSLTLANFNYRKMTLVRDYKNLVESGPSRVRHSTASSRWNLAHRRNRRRRRLAPEEQFLVVPADATQVGAISRARSGDSYIIQGPPGTGKSQTITNLIADQVARGKRVLFVCEKRAAIDVVFHRLRQQGLDELCCLIHDSQTDKKAFVLNLKQTYEGLLAVPEAKADPEAERKRTVRGLNLELDGLTRFSEAMTMVPPDAGVPVHVLIHRLIELEEGGGGASTSGRAVRTAVRGDGAGAGGLGDGKTGPLGATGPTDDLSPEQEELLPGYAAWVEHGETLTRLARALAEVGADACFARHPSRWLAAALVHSGAPLRELRTRLKSVDRTCWSLGRLRGTGPRRVRRCSAGLGGWIGSGEACSRTRRRRRHSSGAVRWRCWRTGLRPGGDSKPWRLNSRRRKRHPGRPLQKRSTGASDSRRPTRRRRSRRPGSFQVRRADGSSSGTWWRLRTVLNERYNFAAHAVIPSWDSDPGRDLEAAQTAEAAVARHDATSRGPQRGAVRANCG